MAQNFKKCNNNDVTKNQEKARKKSMQIWKCEMSHIDPWGHGKKRTRKSNDEKKRKRNELEDLLFKKVALVNCHLHTLSIKTWKSARLLNFIAASPEI